MISKNGRLENLAGQFESLPMQFWDETLDAIVKEITTEEMALLKYHIAFAAEALAFPTGTQCGEYKLIHQIAAGGFGAVFLAEQTLGTDRRQVAVKFLKRPNSLAGEGQKILLQRFLNEAGALCRLKHPNLVTVYSANIFHTFSDGPSIPFLAMEFVGGAPLHHACRGKSPEEVCKVMGDICEGLQSAHNAGMMHLDLKPDNILTLSSENGLRPVIVDFGLAREFMPLEPLSARYQAGTLPYKAPEQINPALGGPDYTTDVYALGVILFQILTDRLPYFIENWTTENLGGAILGGRRLKASDFRAGLTARLVNVIDRAIKVDRHERFNSPREFRAALEECFKAKVPAGKKADVGSSKNVINKGPVTVQINNL